MDSFFLRFLYHTIPGRAFLKLLTAPSVSSICGKFLDSSFSCCLISGFIRKNGIHPGDYINQTYTCFNDFFSREIRPELRPIDSNPEHLIAPCDGLLSVYPLDKKRIIPIKQSCYSVKDLLGCESLAEQFSDGLCLVFRLCVNNYHRYCYADSGWKSDNTHISGILHTVRPIALEALPVFTTNSREYTLIQSPCFGPILQMEVGALLVGKIENYHRSCEVKRGKEKGRFLYGGSTVILLLKKGAAVISEDILSASIQGKEYPVIMGQQIGRKDHAIAE